MDPEAVKLAAEIEASRQEIAKLQERVRQLVARRGKRAELVKTTTILPTHDLPPHPVQVGPGPTGDDVDRHDDFTKELTIEEGLAALQNVPMSEVRLIAFKHGAVVFLFANEKTLTVRMDERGPKPLLDLLTANDHHYPSSRSVANQAVTDRPRA